MINPDQKQMFDGLALQRKNQQRVDRILKIVLPVMAFLISVICANLNWQSTLGTFLVLGIAFYAVGIRHLNLSLWLGIVALYCLVDIYFTYQGNLPLPAIGRQMGTMLTFTGIVGLGRPYLDSWLMRNT